MENKYEVIKDKNFNKWLIFEQHGSLLVEVDKNLRSTRKKDCDEWIEKQTRRKTNRKQVRKAKTNTTGRQRFSERKKKNEGRVS